MIPKKPTTNVYEPDPYHSTPNRVLDDTVIIRSTSGGGENVVYNADERDPRGIDQHAPGAKLDDGKPFVDDILAGFSRALMCVCKVGTFGAKKYSLNGWKEVKDGIRRYRNAAGRHRLYRQQGEIYDKDSGMKHEWHEAWNILAALELEQKFQEEHGCT